LHDPIAFLYLFYSTFDFHKPLPAKWRRARISVSFRADQERRNITGQNGKAAPSSGFLNVNINSLKEEERKLSRKKCALI